jgi:hypothetical protein
MTSNVIPMTPPPSADVKAAMDYGYTVHTLTNTEPQWDEPDLVGKWWWCLSKPGWIDCVTDPDEHATEAEAWACAVQHHHSEAALDAREEGEPT